MVRFLLLTSSIISVFVLSWCLGRLFSPQNCINSTLVGKVVISASGDQPAEVYSGCYFLGKILNPSPALWVRDTQLLERVDRLQSVADYVDLSDAPIKIKILRSVKNEISFQGTDLLISSDLVEKPGLLERAVLFMKVNNGQPLTGAVVADFLWRTQVERLPLNERLDSSGEQFWFKSLKSLSQYCRSSERLLLHHGFCEAHNELGDSMMVDLDSGPVEWSLKPILEGLLHSIYQNANLKEKQHILNNILFLGEWSAEFTETLAQSRSFSAANSAFSNMVVSWLMPLTVNEDEIKDALALYTDVEKTPLSVFVVGRSSRDAFAEDVVRSAKASADNAEELVFLSGSRVQFQGSDVEWKFDRKTFLATVRAENLIYLSCELPDVESLLEYAPATPRITFVQYCDGDSLDWNKISQLGIRDYLTQNKSIQFVEFNLAALSFAKKVRGPLARHEDFTSWQRWLMWQKIVDDDSGRGTHRPLSVIDGVARFRFL